MAASDSVSPFDREGMYDIRRRAILREAGRQFARRGFHATSLDDVARSLKLTKAGLYHYFENKEQLLYECYLASIETAERCVAEASVTGTNGLEKVCNYIRLMFAIFDKPDGYFALMVEMTALGTEHQKLLRRRGRIVDTGLRAFIEEGIEDGSIRACDAAVIEFAIQGALNWIPKWYSERGRKTVAEIIEDFIDFFTSGLRPR